jgi:heme-degrading monooxygenase HmoA
MKTFVIYAIYLLTCLIQSGAFSSPYIKVTPSSVVLSASVTEEDIDLATAKGLVRRDRYIATNRFAVRKDQQAKFEKRWATRKSRVASLPGFRYFHLMRRVTLNDDGSCSYDGGETEEEAQENYVSFTIWDKKSDFSAWRKGGKSN